MQLTYIQQSGSPPVGDGGDQYTGLDRFGRVVDQRWFKDSSGADLERVQYGFDRASNRVWRKNTVAASGQDEYYTYDGLNQLLTLRRGTLNTGRTGITGTPAWEEDLTFDPTGNWDNYVNKVSGTTTLNQPRTHNAANEVETISGSSALMAQNAAGNVSKAPQPTDWSSAYTMAYDAWQRLVKVSDGSSVVAAYGYDGQSRRVTKTTGTTTRHYYYSSRWQVLEERVDAATSAARQFVWGRMGLDNLVLRDKGTARLYSLQDVSNCTAVVNASGAVKERYGYNGFGLSRVMTPAFGSRANSSYGWETRYACYRYDSESDFYQVRNRYLHPTLGRWLSRDPIGYQGGINFYAYVGNHSINMVDPFGLTSVEGVTASLVAYIADFNPGDYYDPILDYYEEHIGTLTLGRAHLLLIGLNELETSTNPSPPSSFTTSSWQSFVDAKQYRGFLYMKPKICCKDGKVKGYSMSNQGVSNGWTPIRATRDGPVIKFLPGEGNNSLTNSALGKSCITLTWFHRMRIGRLGQIAAIVLNGAGVPYAWQKIEYKLCCDKSYSITFSGSEFPSQNAYINWSSVASYSQQNLVNFIFAGAGVDAPGGSFYTAEGSVP